MAAPAECPHVGAEPQCPPGGAEPQCPHGGGDPQCPHGGAEPQCPHGGGDPQCPHGGAEPQCPHSGGDPQCPHGGAEPQCPHSGGDPQCPHGGAEPQCPHGGAAACPHGGGDPQHPPGGAARCPHGGAARCPHGGGVPQRPHGGAARCPRGGAGPRRRKGQRPFDFSQHGRRRVALRLAYLGWGYQGFASQENTPNTVEERLFEALLKTRLVESRQNANYHRSGRTDKGVSAFGQVISLDVRSNQRGEAGAEGPEGLAGELRYTHMLNRVLPADIRALAWAPAGRDFSARFSCLHRTYHYYFPASGLALGRMDGAARRFEGTHDFRNLCKMDVANRVTNFRRTVLRARVEAVPEAGPEPSGNGPAAYRMCRFEVRGLAFLYHQVRCMAAVLLLIGQGLEEPEVIDQLLDVDRNPRKPQYSMAVDYPLVLYDCAYENLEWIVDPDARSFTVSQLHSMWTQHAIKTRILYSMLQGLGQAPSEEERGSGTDPLRERERDRDPPPDATPRLADRLMEGVRPRRYKRLMERELCEGLESRILHYAKRGRIELPASMRVGGQEGGRPKEVEEDDDAAPALPHPPR
ncbi:tRNA pseudouridine(38/39) synthase [Hemiscyllium ocellatum]|uniref:tRNA pseudouridine(38/39) synthase n=1 Tax=Hemiscyllium ocellatum TaxID=170820 RepID=UPI0029666DFF|nr:tRNA pseudouridine(38/39) synthase [Hemiscyllium ocellatum]